MRIVILSNDILVNNGFVSVINNTIMDSSHSCIRVGDYDYEFYYSIDDFEKSSSHVSNILFMICLYKVASCESNFLIRYIEINKPNYPILLYTPDILNKDFIQYLYSTGVHSVISQAHTENDIVKVISKIMCYSQKKIGLCTKLHFEPLATPIENKLPFSPSNYFDSNIYSTNISSGYNLANHVSVNISDSFSSSPVSVNKISSEINLDYEKIGISLTNRKKKLVQGLILGQSNKDISKLSNLSVGTVRNYIHQLSSHFNVNNRTELAIKLRNLISE